MSDAQSTKTDGMLCPACRIDLVMSDRQGIEIDYCPKCRGVWLDRGELDKIIERSARELAPPAGPESTAPGFLPPPGSLGPWGSAPAPAQAPVGYPSYPPHPGYPPQTGHGGYDDHGDSHGGRGSHGGGSHGGRRGFLGRIFD
jgi:hypothetical protein